MKSSIAQLVEQAVSSLPHLAEAPEISSIASTVERTRDARHGDFTTNIAMCLAKTQGKNPRDVAAEIIEKVPASELVDKVDIAGPGFINFHVSKVALHRELAIVLQSDLTDMKKALAAATTGETKILVGTQMLSKGHHFPNLTLVVVINADHGLFSTDFRGGERLPVLADVIGDYRR